jgi:chromosome partitioning protein
LELILVQASLYDVWAAQEAINLIQETSVFKEKLKSVFVINCRITNTAIGRDVAESLSGYGVPVLRSQICDRVSFAESAASGQTMMEIDPNGQAAQEINAYMNELLEVHHG